MLALFSFCRDRAASPAAIPDPQLRLRARGAVAVARSLVSNCAVISLLGLFAGMFSVSSLLPLLSAASLLAIDARVAAARADTSSSHWAASCGSSTSASRSATALQFGQRKFGQVGPMRIGRMHL